MENTPKKYIRFAAMIATSMVAMFAIMYLNSYSFAHATWSETRFYMTFVMGAVMAVVMLSFMLNMLNNTRVNLAILGISVIVFSGALWLVRSQTTVQDTSYMSAMIPHHSIAILTSERANFDDVRVQELANEIIRAQRREIKEMSWLIDDIAANGPVKSQQAAGERPVPDFEGNL